MPHLVVDISSHGFGHLAQVAPVVESLVRQRPDVAVTARCALPQEIVRARMPSVDRLVTADLDVGMVMASALEVRVAASHAAHLELHRDWPARVAREAEALAALGPDLVLADVPYLSLAAARAAGIRAVALCSLNWADIYAPYCGHLPGAGRVLAEMTQAYAAVDLFLQATPHLPMAWIPRRRAIAPVAPATVAGRAATRARLGLTEDVRLLLVALGGIDTRLPLEHWPPIPDALWLVPQSWGMAADHVRPVTASGPAFSDLLAAADLVLTKPGYGTFVEAAAAGVPVLWLEREDWPETPYLERWLTRHVANASLSPVALSDGSTSAVVERLLERGRRPSTRFSGAVEAARALDALL